MGQLLGLKFLITPVYYWVELYIEPHSVPFMFIVGLCFNYTSLFTTFIMVKFDRYINSKIAVIMSFFVSFVVFVAIPMMGYVGAIRDNWKIELGLTLLFISVSGICSSVLASKLLSMISVLPSKYQLGFMFGNGIGGVFTAIMVVATYFGTTDTNTLQGATKSATLFFSIGAIMFLICCVLVIVLFRNQYFLSQSSMPKKLNLTLNDLEPNVKPSSLHILKIIKIPVISLFIMFTTVMSLYPGVSSMIKPPRTSIFFIDPVLKGFYPVLLSAVFQISNTVGRFIPRLIKVLNHESIWIAALFHLIFIPAYFLMTYPRNEPYIWTNVYPFIIVSLLAMFNGYFTSVCFVYGSNHPKLEPSEKSTATIILVFFLAGGVWFGAHLGYYFHYILTGIWF
eukprot:TRINITY_DN2625_c3_g1_i2.p1 TRINITY_DN2625_c3_g1~~TRINITY_DN2625_c3_g1_i2.p1  ORF type:complete len:395 (+),score=27.97 TRINITY_DN2625_c3_g1_i2:563-1747(+)